MPPREPYDIAGPEDLTSSGAWKMRIGLAEERQRVLEESIAEHRALFGERLAALDSRVAQLLDATGKLVLAQEQTQKELHRLAGQVAAWGAALTALAPLITSVIRKLLE